MSRLVLLLGLVLVSALAGGCGSSGVGDPCTIQPPSAEGGFAPTEIYIETLSLQCRTRVCMIYQWDSTTDPTSQSEHEFCTCKCGGPGDPSTFCTCGSDFQCVTAFIAGNPGVQGAYCVRSEIAPDASTGGG